MTYASDTFNGDGSTTEFTLTFDYIQRDHVNVSRIDKATQVATTLSVVTTGQPTGDQYIWETDTKIKVGTAPAATEDLRIVRDTPEDEQIVDWKDGSYIVAEDLNTSDKQWLYNIQELEDQIDLIDGASIEEAPQDSQLYGRENAEWKKVPDPGISDAPDDKLYGRKNGEWSEIPADETGVPEAPNDGKTYARKSQAWTEIQDGGGLSYKGTRDLTQAAPSDVAVGDLYVNTATSGNVDDSWTGIAGDALAGAERVVRNADEWEMLPAPAAADAVTEVVAGTAITVDSADEEKPVVSVTEQTFLPWDISSLDDLPGGGGGGDDPSVSLTSSSVTSGAAIGTDYFYDGGTCGGNNTSPQLSWEASDLASGRSVSSWTLLVVDTDADDFVHWSVTGIPADQASIAENGDWSQGATINDTGYNPDPVRQNGWGGPCPPEEHTYSITLTAVLDDDSTIESNVLQFTAAPGGGGGGGGGGDATVAVTSTSFTAGAAIGQAYYYDQNGCPGQNTSPELSWSISDLPEGRSVASWAVRCLDPDAQNFVHWNVSDIPSSQTSISENGSWDSGAQVAQNDHGGGRDNGWGGPCPPEQHTYEIVVTATLDDDSTVESEALTFTASN